MKEFIPVNGSGGVEIVLSFYQTPKHIAVEGQIYKDLVYQSNDPSKVLHVQRVEEVSIYFPSPLPNTVGLLSVPAHVILNAAARINELQAVELFIKMDE